MNENTPLPCQVFFKASEIAMHPDFKKWLINNSLHQEKKPKKGESVWYFETDLEGIAVTEKAKNHGLTNYRAEMLFTYETLSDSNTI